MMHCTQEVSHTLELGSWTSILTEVDVALLLLAAALGPGILCLNVDFFSR
jgi:hypothetical protein